jgi:hypothetical protein
MSISYAPVPSGPVPWEGNDFDYVSDEDTTDNESECEYDSEDTHSETGSVKFSATLKCRPCSTFLSKYYTSILQEEEYFSE